MTRPEVEALWRLRDQSPWLPFDPDFHIAPRTVSLHGHPSPRDTTLAPTTFRNTRQMGMLIEPRSRQDSMERVAVHEEGRASGRGQGNVPGDE